MATSCSTEQIDGQWYVVRGPHMVAGPFDSEQQALAWIRLLPAGC
jgi:hypothetical protein